MNCGAKTLACSFLLSAAPPATAYPVTDSYQLCVGVIRKSCTSQQQAWWAYIAQEHTKAAMVNPQTVIPW